MKSRLRKAIQQSSRFAIAIIGLLLAASLMGCVLVGVRMLYTQTAHYWFLLWNLALAWVPLVMASVAHRLSIARAGGRVAITLAAALWLLFFPNAPYILTDFLHLGGMGDLVPGWYDVIMLFWFAWTGLLLGVVSLYLMHGIVRKARGPLAGWVFVVVAASLGSFGIYLGRFLRLNSWDLLCRPLPLADQLLSAAGGPLARPRIAAFTVLFALLFLFIYAGVYIFARFAGPSGERSASGSALGAGSRGGPGSGSRSGAGPDSAPRSGAGADSAPGFRSDASSGPRSAPGASSRSGAGAASAPGARPRPRSGARARTRARRNDTGRPRR